MSVEAYQIAVSFVADATRVNRMVDEIIAGMARITAAQREAQVGFTQMASALGGSRRLASGMANDLERAARAARDIASASSRFRGFAGSGGTSASGNGASSARNAQADSASSGSGGAAPLASQRLLPPPPLRLSYDPNAFRTTATAGIPSNSILGGDGIIVGAPYGPAPLTPQTVRSQLLLPPPSRAPSTALTVIPGQGDSYGSGPNFRGSSYTPNFVFGTAATANGPQYGPAVPPGFIRAQQNRQTAQAVASGLGRVAPYVPRIGPWAAFAGIYGGAHGIHAMFRQGEQADDTLALMAHAYGPNGRLFSDLQLSQASDAALAAVRNTPGASYTGTLEMIARASGITADAGEALQLAPTLARAGQIFALRGAGPNAVQQVEAAIQAGEISGLNGPNGQLDVGKLQTFISRLSQTAYAMQGTFSLPQYLTGLRQFGVGASGADMNFLTARLPSIMRVMQESRAGTALSSLDQLMLAPAPNTRNRAYAQEQTRLGLRDHGGNVVNRDELVRDPAQWYYDTLVPALSSHGYTDRNSVIQEMNRIFSRSTVQRLGASLSADTTLYSREYQRNLAQQAQGDAPLMAYLQNAPGAQFSSFTEAWRAFEAVTSQAMMTPVVSSVQLITKALTEVTSYVHEHPNDVRQFGDDVHLITAVMVGAARLIGTAYSLLPAPLRSAALGAAAGAVPGAGVGSVVPGVGTAAGAGTGAVLGGLSGLASWINDRDDRYIAEFKRALAQKNIQVTVRDDRPSPTATTGQWDPLQHPPLPGASPGH
ncbi:hypothetical protein [Tanticharoenia sakaeratensis]|uniref:Uncharacterized protein n=1 Tax=Tanticharoenia sakaeratensis NBRC 103193 TaxID=1231623 RepID=A0A0D6MPA9_9PROT|nr:hypothetical protein [Tanticharoenia sakaeratensis]GAN55261.1 hypothetical protein Tasa_041_056 [Tanticharoenia sakaeratensis NBRC 103193]GBQ23380.1 hypothetical protein AA103193_2397 [Tanticharoenia sakaeratensis NBRC 103193]